MPEPQKPGKMVQTVGLQQKTNVRFKAEAAPVDIDLFQIYFNLSRDLDAHRVKAGEHERFCGIRSADSVSASDMLSYRRPVCRKKAMSWEPASWSWQVFPCCSFRLMKL